MKYQPVINSPVGYLSSYKNGGLSMTVKIIGSNFPTEASDQLMPAWSKDANGNEVEKRLGGSHVNGYGQNQYGGPVSTTPGQSITSGYEAYRPKPIVNDQVRKVEPTPLAPTFGHRNRKGE